MGVQQNFYFLARRFVAGEDIDSAMRAVRSLNSSEMSATLDFLGEDVHERAAAVRQRDVYLEMLDAIEAAGVDSNVSVKMTAMGLLIDEDFALENLMAILERAGRNADPFVRIDMEGSAVTEATLRLFRRAFAERKNVGPVLQAYLKRTGTDVREAIGLGARVRLCKGRIKNRRRSHIKVCPRFESTISNSHASSCCVETTRASLRTIVD